MNRSPDLSPRGAKTTKSPQPVKAEVKSRRIEPSSPIVFVVDDDISVRESLDLLIRKQGWQPKIFSSGQEFLESARVLVPNCLLLDLSLPGLNGLDLQKRIVIERAEMPIIFITGYGDVPKSVEAMKGGAAEFLTKPLNHEVLLSAIRQSLERSRLALTRQAELQTLRNRYASLTAREREVMAWIVSGLLNKQVGGQMDIAESTVKAHRGQVMQKMNAESLADLVKMASKLRVPEATQSSGPQSKS
jgi:FixJ family two-component response regulator